jgi:hypothetical protein
MVAKLAPPAARIKGIANVFRGAVGASGAKITPVHKIQIAIKVTVI